MKTPEEIEKKITETLKKYKESYAPWELEECDDCHPYERESMVEFGKEIYKQAIQDNSDSEKITVKTAFENLFEEIKHGDQEHQDWLKQKMDHFLNSNY
jgi:hypothetical protein